ncbi:MAG: M20/M25/M40 family metallo-hydrolase [Chloroflexi bacterium]|nr:M20/M25/M40 family metallo-hydrolase [Chloroflexota bacterium]
MSADPTLYQRPAELLQHLLRFDTTNPPGNEAPLLHFVRDMLHAAGFETLLLGKDAARPNLIARLKGRGDAPPLLLQGHVDVVTTANQVWQQPPFSGALVDGWVWGRGALDMKGGVTMLLCALLRAKMEGLVPPGDVILALMSDEEAGSDHGSKYLVENHAELFAGVRYALGEFGGFSLYVAGSKFYPIMVAERQGCPLQVTVRGPGGHGAQPMRGGAMAKTARVLAALDENLPPIRIVPVVRQMVEAMAAALPAEAAALFLKVLDPQHSDTVIDQLGNGGRMLRPLLRNTANATIIHGGSKLNVIPSEIVIQLDGRTLPGVQPEDFIAEIRAIIGDEPEIAPMRYTREPMPTPDLTHFATLAQILREADPQATPIPYVVSGGTDASVFARLGIQTYGFLPMNLPMSFNFGATVHGADERITVEALLFGVEAVYQAVQRLGA